MGNYGLNESRDEAYYSAVRIALDLKGVSSSILQRRLSIGQKRAAKMLEMMIAEGIVGEANARGVHPIENDFVERIEGLSEL